MIEEVATDLGGSASQPGQMQKNVSKVKQKARACLQEMVAGVSPAFIRYLHVYQLLFWGGGQYFQTNTACRGLFSFTFIIFSFRLTGWILLRLFNGFFWSIQIHKGQLEMVKKAATEVNITTDKSLLTYFVKTAFDKDYINYCSKLFCLFKLPVLIWQFNLCSSQLKYKDIILTLQMDSVP